MNQRLRWELRFAGRGVAARQQYIVSLIPRITREEFPVRALLQPEAGEMRLSERIDVLNTPVDKDSGIRGVNLISGRRAYGQHRGAWNPELEARRKMTQGLAGAGGNRHLIYSKGNLRVGGDCYFVSGCRSEILQGDAHSRRATFNLLLDGYFADTDVSP